MKKIFLYLFGFFIIYYILSRILVKQVEGYQSTYYANTDINTDISSEYSKTVDLPITFPFSCKNFCGPGNKCAITGEQCSNDYDCSGCENVNKFKPPKVMPHYNELSSNNEQMDYVYAGSKNNLTPSYTSGQNEWIKNFNFAMKLYNRKELYNNPLDDFEKNNVATYPNNVSMTGKCYETTPQGYNASI
jgi:hypothetical protein